MLFSGKENVFMCLVAFQKIFRKIFSGVWKRRRKRQSQQNTDKTQKKTQAKNHQRSTLDWVRWRGASRAPVRQPRSREASIAISDRGRRIGAREIGADWSSGFAGDRRTGLELGLLPLAPLLSLSLSLSLQKYFEVKMKV